MFGGTPMLQGREARVGGGGGLECTMWLLLLLQSSAAAVQWGRLAGGCC